MKRKPNARKRSSKKPRSSSEPGGMQRDSSYATPAQPALMAHDDETCAVARARLVAQLDLHTESNFFSGFSGDLSDGGLFVSTYQPLSPGQAVEVELSLPGGHTFSAQGHVAWLRSPCVLNDDISPGAGIVFDELDPQARKLAESFMLYREPTFVDAN